MDRTLILVKPDAFARNLTGEIIARFERKVLRIAPLRYMTMDRALAEQHYAEHQGKRFFEELLSFITSGPLEAWPGPTRGDFAVEVGQNIFHGSDSPESAEREASLFFPQG